MKNRREGTGVGPLALFLSLGGSALPFLPRGEK